jgi:hypothetical protein
LPRCALLVRCWFGAHNERVELHEAMGREEWAEVISHSFVPLAIGETSTEFRGEVSQAVLSPEVTLTDVHTHGRSGSLRVSSSLNILELT